MLFNRSSVEVVLRALAERLALVGAPTLELVVVGGAALNALGLVERTTTDVDLVATVSSGTTGDLLLRKLDKLPAYLIEQAIIVARQFGLAEQWLNTGPADLMDEGLPAGFAKRMIRREYGQGLIVYFAGRLDQIHFKLYAAVDQGPGRHFADLQALEPSAAEFEQAASWALTHDDSEGFRQELQGMLRDMGHASIADRL